MLLFTYIAYIKKQRQAISNLFEELTCLRIN